MAYSVDNYLQALKNNLAKQSDTLIAQFEYLKTLDYAKEVDHLQIISSLGDEKIGFHLFSMSDLFSEVYAEEDTEGFADSIELLEEFTFEPYDYNDEFEAFYEENDLERAAINTLGDWVYECFLKADGQAIPRTIHFGIHDDSYMLNLHSGEWFDPDDVEE